jgi:hypothetical protein
MPDIYSTQAQARVANGGTLAYPRVGWTNSLGHALIEQLTLDIAAARVETIDSRLLEILDEYNTPLEKVPVVNDLIKRKDHGFTETSFGWPPSATAGTQPYNETVVVPLPFWFTIGDMGCALPIDSIVFDDVRVGISFRDLNGLYYTKTHVPNTSTAPGTSLWPLAGTNFYPLDPVVNQGQVPLSNASGVIQMPNNLQLGSCYILAEYVYLDSNESNRFRLADLQIPIVTHTAINPYDTRGLPTARIPLNIFNPVRDLFFMLNRVEAPTYNAYFLATRDLTGAPSSVPDNSELPWWPDGLGLYSQSPSIFLRPAFSLSDSEPISGLEVVYEGSLTRFRSQAPALFRSILNSYEQRKTPWVNRYYYNFPFGIQNGMTPFSQPQGESNFSKIVNKDLVLQLKHSRGYVGGTVVPRYVVYVYACVYNIIRVYGGRCSLLFAN